MESEVSLTEREMGWSRLRQEPIGVIRKKVGSLKVPSRWRILGRMSLLAGFLIYLDQIFRRNYPWHWSGLWHHQTMVAIAVSVGITLMVVAAVETRQIRTRRKLKSKNKRATADSER